MQEQANELDTSIKELKPIKSLAALLKDFAKLYDCPVFQKLNEQALERLAAFPATIQHYSCEIIESASLQAALSLYNQQNKQYNLKFYCSLSKDFRDIKLLRFIEKIFKEVFKEAANIELIFQFEPDFLQSFSKQAQAEFFIGIYPYLLYKLQAEISGKDNCFLQIMQLEATVDGLICKVPEQFYSSYPSELFKRLFDLLKYEFNLDLAYQIKKVAEIDTEANLEDQAYQEQQQLLKRMIKEQAAENANVPLPSEEAASGKATKAKQGQWLKDDDPNFLYGHVPVTDNISSLTDFNIQSQKVLVKGKVHNLEANPTRDGKNLIIKFALFGVDGAVQCFLFGKEEKLTPLSEQLQEKMWISAYVEASSNRYTNELEARILGIKKTEAPAKREDTAEKKRVELHCHSQMSAKDGFAEPKEIIRLAAHFGHKACAITDHGVVQAYPLMYEEKKALAKQGKQIKLIYGMEGYLVDDGNCVAFGLNIPDTPLTSFVAFDLETTGLNAHSDKIIELAAVRYKLNKDNVFEEVDKFTTFVNPGGMLSPKISQLTGIESLDLVGQPTISEVIPKFYEWLGNDPLVAHNGLFDLSFLRYAAFSLVKGTEARIKFNNILIDTVEMARTFYTGLSNYKLDTVANALHVELKQHHRALDDTRCCGEIFIKLLAELGIKDLASLNRKAGKEDIAQIKVRTKQVLHFIALCRDQLGLYNLYRLVSESHIHYFSSRPRIPRSLLRYFKAGLILGSSCEAGEVYRSMHKLYRDANKNMVLAKERLSEYQFKKMARFYDYLEIQPLANNHFFLRDESSGIRDENDLANINRLIIALAEKNHKPYVATCDSHFLEQNEQIYRNMLLSVNGFADADFSPCLYFRTTNEMLDCFNYLSEEERENAVITYPNEIAEQIIDNLPPFPEGTFPPEIPTADKEIHDLVWQEVKRLYEYKGKLPEIVEKRVHRELDSIIKNGFAIMYYISSKLVKQSNADGYFVGSRGSVGSSFVATLCGITEVNPLPAHYLCLDCHYSEFVNDSKYDSGFDLPRKACPNCHKLLQQEGQNIPFETFLGFNGDKEPDIDLNFSGEYQSRAHNFIKNMFGEEYTFRAGTISAYQEKNAIGVVKKYAETHEQNYTAANILRLANGICGVKRTTGQHPGGIVVIPKDRDIYDFTPIQYPADNQDSSMYTTHFDFNSLHDTILKFDCLGHDAPTQLKRLKDFTGVDFLTVPLNDPKVMSLYKDTSALELSEPDFQKVGCLGLPEQGTIMARGMIVETKPKSFYDLVQLAGLSHGTNVWNGNARDLINDGVCTIDQVIGCRDNIMTTLLSYNLPAKMSFDIMEKVRKGRGLTDEQIAKMRECKVPEWYIESCLKIQYLFPKAHAVAYVMSALRIAWYKVYRKQAFYAVWLGNNIDEFSADIIIGKSLSEIRASKEAYFNNFNKLNPREKKLYYILEIVEEMMLRGVKLLPIDLYKSDANYFLPEGDNVRPPFAVMPKFPKSTAEQIVKVRKDGEFLAKEDLSIRADVKQAAMEALEHFHVVDKLPEQNQMDLASLAAQQN